MNAADKIKQIEELAALQFLPEQIALILDLSEEELQTHDAKTAMLRGSLVAEAEVRKSIFQMAKQGSTPAQKQMLQIIESNRSTEQHNKPADNDFDLGVEL